ncbi:hypothetical protein [Halochromatium roseum]|uniref:hypothetical protein n=1 Tax=Halochromatium roseum TaxID=391920 RepID=UPI0019129720|nr:hypothetical protein [Halochromatium roseum]MBK5939807.1 hypothetical protein [Halochromatium roseum]
MEQRIIGRADRLFQIRLPGFAGIQIGQAAREPMGNSGNCCGVCGLLDMVLFVIFRALLVSRMGIPRMEQPMARDETADLAHLARLTSAA